jgi:pimeloyl-ACP methyl ester carboxylesterase
MPFFHREGLDFYYEEHGTGPGFVFSHGLGGNLTHAQELIGDLPGVRLILYDNRGHGRTSGIGDPSRLTFSVMAEDMAALLDFLEVTVAIIGGVSMGAGISTAFALANPARARALILSRPAWLNESSPPNLAVLPEIADLVELFGCEDAAEHFKRSAQFASLAKVNSETAKSLAESFTERDAEAIISTFRKIPVSKPFQSWDQLAQLNMPALILANRNDPLHPYEYSERLRAALPRSRLQEFPSKSEGLELHQKGFRELVRGFLREQSTA